MVALRSQPWNPSGSKYRHRSSEARAGDRREQPQRSLRLWPPDKRSKVADSTGLVSSSRHSHQLWLAGD